MNVIGVICEFDPLHLGHAALLRRVRAQFGADAAAVCVMSGDYVQRGSPAVFGKYARANAAVACGADLVLELPVTRALSSAEGFADGGVELLRRLGRVDALAFGCECGDATRLMAAAQAMQRPEFDTALRDALKTGVSYAAARERALCALGGDGSLLQNPNDILAAEYCRAILRQGAGFSVFAVRREGDYHAAAPDPLNPSATAVRSLIASGGDWLPYIPEAAREIFRAAPRHFPACGERAVLARLRAMTEAEWEQTAHGSEGLWRKAMKAVHTEPTVERIAAAAKSKRYPMTRVRRLLLCAYLGLTAQELRSPMEDCRVLACSERGREVLRLCRGGAIALRNPGERSATAERDRRCADLYALFAESDADVTPGREKSARINFAKK